MKNTYSLWSVVFSFIITFTIVAVVVPVGALAQTDDFGFGDENIFASPFSVDLKVNGSDGPVTIAMGERIVVNWLTNGADRCRANFSRNNMPATGTVAGKLNRSVTIRFACVNNAGERLDDFVLVNISGLAPAIAPQLPLQSNVVVTGFHSADYNKNWKIDDAELLRVNSYRSGGDTILTPQGTMALLPVLRETTAAHTTRLITITIGRLITLNTTEFSRTIAREVTTLTPQGTTVSLQGALRFSSAAKKAT